MAANSGRKRNVSSTTVSAIQELNHFWAQVDAARSKIGAAGSVRPPNSFTVLEYAAKYKISESAARRQVDKMKTQGVVVEHRVTLPNSAGSAVVGKVYTANA